MDFELDDDIRLSPEQVNQIMSLFEGPEQAFADQIMMDSSESPPTANNCSSLQDFSEFADQVMMNQDLNSSQASSFNELQAFSEFADQIMTNQDLDSSHVSSSTEVPAISGLVDQVMTNQDLDSSHVSSSSGLSAFSEFADQVMTSQDSASSQSSPAPIRSSRFQKEQMTFLDNLDFSVFNSGNESTVPAQMPRFQFTTVATFQPQIRQPQIQSASAGNQPIYIEIDEEDIADFNKYGLSNVDFSDLDEPAAVAQMIRQNEAIFVRVNGNKTTHWSSSHPFQTPSASSQSTSSGSFTTSSTAAAGTMPFVRSSEAAEAHASSALPPLSKPGSKKQKSGVKKRSRTTINSAQKEVLLAAYKRSPFPSGPERNQLGLEIGLDPRQIQIWFQNSRRLDKEAGILISLRDERMRREQMMYSLDQAENQDQNQIQNHIQNQNQLQNHFQIQVQDQIQNHIQDQNQLQNQFQMQVEDQIENLFLDQNHLQNNFQIQDQNQLQNNFQIQILDQNQVQNHTQIQVLDQNQLQNESINEAVPLFTFDLPDMPFNI